MRQSEYKRQYTLVCACGERWTGVRSLAELCFWELAHTGEGHQTTVIRESDRELALDEALTGNPERETDYHDWLDNGLAAVRGVL